MIYPELGLLYVAFAGVLFVIGTRLAGLVLADRRAYDRGRMARHLRRIEDQVRAGGPRPHVAKALDEIERARLHLEAEQEGDEDGT